MVLNRKEMIWKKLLFEEETFCYVTKNIYSLCMARLVVKTQSEFYVHNLAPVIIRGILFGQFK